MNKKLKILIITPTYLPAYHVGGPIFQIKQFSNQLKKKKIFHKILTTSQSLTFSKKKEKDVLYLNSYLKNLYFSFSLIIFLIKNIRNFNKVYIVSCFNFFSTISCFFCRIYKIDYYLSPRGSLMKDSINIKNKLIKKIWIHLFEMTNINNAKRIIFSSTYEKIETKKIIKVKKNEVIENFIQNKITKKNNVKKNYLLYFGRIHPNKNIKTIIESYLSKFKFKIKIIGPGNDTYISYLKKLVLSKNLENDILFFKPIYNIKKNKIYREAKYSILLSDTENFGNTILESILNFTPVIISKNIGLSDLVKKYDAGYVINNNISSLRNIFLKIQNKKKIHKISKKTVFKIFNIFKNEKIINKYLKIFYIK
jgi:glycosyltransferase involved in cell wall biosynthesis